MREGDIIHGLAKGLAVIEVFDAAHARLSITDVAALTGLERATARRCLLTLTSLGYASYDGKFFMLTPRVLRLGHSYLAATPLPGIIQPVLERLTAATGESASASVLDGTDILYIARASLRRVMSINLSPGTRLPAYCSSMGRVLLAAMPAAAARSVLERSALLANTPKTRTDIGALMDELAVVGRQGYAVIDEELELGLRSIAVPLLNARGETIAALNIGAQAARIGVDAMVAHYLPQMRAAQAELQPLLH
ncbi:IclR family transcriptional regulator [Devosia limi DSM 17137]|uniref:IclR family transcriptional regulator n=1 Tax=Devosia limi DSM 17137 TaxID=1121477 RepID=A0A0F5LU84_9HYPH|nr:IclR family transcriptional regulator C-terminal domain-containing protein [Devosia limi]KKB85846.1 IclR family transcriptional regulator [Devosia limi DSM 17137]SHE35372.1 transcriptional regulator, IclR family [Devosia limi DSM 17137]